MFFKSECLWLTLSQGTNARFNGREICDCYREEPAERRGNIENRYYHNEVLDVWVTFFQWFNPACGHQGHNLTWLNVSVPPPRLDRAPKRYGQTPDVDEWRNLYREGRHFQEKTSMRSDASAMPLTSTLHLLEEKEASSIPSRQRGCEPGACDQEPHWVYDVYGLFTNVVPLLNPDVLVFNSGHWGRLPGAYDLERLAQSAIEAVRVSNGRVVYKTTTWPRCVWATGRGSRVARSGVLAA